MVLDDELCDVQGDTVSGRLDIDLCVVVETAAVSEVYVAVGVVLGGEFGFLL